MCVCVHLCCTSLLWCLQDALADRDLVHRQTAAAVVQHLALGVAGLSCEDALTHLLNFVWPNIFEDSPHLINGVIGAIDGCRLALGPCVVLHYTLQVRLRVSPAGLSACAALGATAHCAAAGSARKRRCGDCLSETSPRHVSLPLPRLPLVSLHKLCPALTVCPAANLLLLHHPPHPRAQGLFHPARKVRQTYWKVYNNLYIGAQDALVAFMPSFPDTEDGANTYVRHELEIVL